MTETKEVRHAGIGIQLNIGGMEEFRRLNDDIDKLLGKFRDLKDIAGSTKGLFAGFGNASQSINKATSSVSEVHKITRDLKMAADKASQGFKSMSSDISETKRAANGLQKDADFSSPVDKSTRSVKEACRAMHESQDSLKKYSDAMTHLPTQKFTEVRDKIVNTKKSADDSANSIKKETDETKKSQSSLSKLHDTIRNSFIFTTVSSGLSWLTSEIKTITQQGYALAEGGEQIRDQWKNIGLNDKQAHGMTDQIAEIRGQSNFAGSALDAMQKKFYAATDSIPKAKELTNEMAAYGMAAGKSGEQIQQISMGVAKLTGSKKVSAGFFQRSFGQMPALQKAVVKASGMTNQAFNSALQNGKITGSKLQGYLSKAAKNSSKEWSAFSKTTRGQMASISGTFQNLKAVFAAPLVGGISQAMDTIDKKKGGLGDVKKQLQDIAKALGTKMGTYVGDAIKFLVKNRKALAEMGSALFSITKNLGLGVWKAFAGTAALLSGHGKDSTKNLKSTADWLKEISKHVGAIQTIGKTIAGIWATSKLISGYTAGKNFLGFGEKAGLILKPKVDGEKGEKELTRFASTIRHPIQRIKGDLKWTAEVATKGAKKIVSGFSIFAKKVGGPIKRGLSFTAHVATKAAVKSLGLLKKAALGVGKGFRSIFTFAKNNPSIAIVTAVVAIITVLVELYKHNKKFRNFVNGLLKWGKKFATGIGKWFGQAYKSVIKIMGKLVSGVNKRWGSLWRDLVRVFKTEWSAFKSLLRVFYDVFTGRFTDLKKDIPKLARNMFKVIISIFKGAYDYIDNLTGGRLSKINNTFAGAWKDIGKGWKSFWNGIDDWFSNLWKGIVKHVQDGINSIIDTLNGGIKGIDFVISKFGGSDKAIGTINHVHLATGTGVFGNQRRAITRPTMAMLNDGHDSPETGNREMLIHPNGLSELIKGTNVMRMLEPGAEVLNASEARQMMGVDHFANGTGFLSGIWKGTKNIATGAWDGAKSLGASIASTAKGVAKATIGTFNTVKKIISNPTKYLNNMLTKPKGSGEILSSFASGMYGGMKKQAKQWWSSLWGMVNLDGGGSQGSGSRGAFLDEAIKLGHAARGYSESAGRLGPEYYDCSGLVYTALKHLGVHVGGGSTTGPEYQFTSPVSWSKARPGDLAFWGSGGSEHVGIVSNTSGSGRMYNAENPTDGIKYGPIKGFMSGFAGLRRISQLHDDDTKGSSKKSTTAGSINKNMKKQVGSGFFSFMDKLASMFGVDNSGGGPNAKPSGDHMHWLKQAGIPKSEYDMYNYIISHESGWNPHATNSGSGAYGLPQSLPGSKMASAGSDWKTNPITQLKWMKDYVTHGNYHSINQAYAHWQANHWYAKGGDVPADQLSVVGEKGWELFKPKSGGHVFDHETSKKILSRGSQKIDIHGATIQMTVTGNADANTVSKLQSVMNDSNDALVEKIRETLGLNDDGGLIV
ncbi:aggregation-promoting factor C-terminal-like domain-containing protein [Lactiplantibacillus daowaiensis]|uniref:Tape measure protein n=1 Tax=Lactiplantibacillus daowaiensis TaxID=2559918 RepID=A0ABW1RX42_9LACO|nr:tape measure protein [Lactiplantibacillus daowaiensis]